MIRRAAAALPLFWLLSCAGPAAAPPGTAPSPDPGAPPAATRPALEPIAPPAFAAANDWMALGSTNVPGFRAALPEADGRGVLIAILDSGLDPTVPGLDRTSTGEVKVLDLQDFSGEGRIGLSPAVVAGDTVRLREHWVLGAGRLRALTTAQPILAGTLMEVRLGVGGAADLNGSGTVVDTLLVVVTRATDGWVLFADTDGDGTLADERPVRDYRAGRETFGWHSGNRVSPYGVAVSFREGGGQEPQLDLVFDNSGHGTHVAGIAGGHSLYRVDGFDGVAPGASLLGLKISNDARGGITVTGSIVQAVEYAIRQARSRRMPLVINLSFGVGNEAEGEARIDAVLDSLLAENPDVIMTVSAGNDGPGLSTIGFPGSAKRVISVGATYPGVFLPPTRSGRKQPDLMAFFSARGGDSDRPDLVAPGLAYSTVVRWEIGEEVKSGTSMAAPHVAGLAARLISALVAEGRGYTAESIRNALVGSAGPIGRNSRGDQGAGQPDLQGAWEILTGVRSASPTLPLRAEPLVPRPIRPDTIGFSLEGGMAHRIAVATDSGRAFRVTLEEEDGAPLLLFLHEPGGRPGRGGQAASSGGEEPWAELRVDGRDALGGSYEVIAVAGPGDAFRGVVIVDPAPAIVGANRVGDSVDVVVRASDQGFIGSVNLEVVGGERGRAIATRGSTDHQTTFGIPAWADRVVAEVSMERDQWPRFTDFGLTLEEATGQIIAVAPLNYAVGRLEYDVLPGHRLLGSSADGAGSRQAGIVLSPGFADPGAETPWNAELRIRTYGGPAFPASSQQMDLRPGTEQTIRLALPASPGPLGQGFDPLGRITLRTDQGEWATEVRLGPPLPPIMR